MSSSSTTQNYYKLLNLPPTATTDEIRKAISRELRLWSNRTNAPDMARRQEAERVVRILGEAESVLLDQARRAAYDKTLSAMPTAQREFTDTQLEGEGDLVAEARRLLATDNIADALYVATKATERDGNNPEAWAVLAQAKFRWGDTEDAIYEYKRAIKLRPNEASYYFDLGSVYEFLDRANDALQQYQRAAQIEPHTTMYRAAIGVMLIRADEIARALQILEQCVAEDPNNPAYQRFLAIAYVDDAHRDWTYVPDGNPNGIPCGYYATKRSHVARAQELVSKAEGMKFDDPELAAHIKSVRADIDRMLTRKFCGNIATAVVGGLVWSVALYGAGIPLALAYVWASRAPLYALNEKAIAGDSTTAKYLKASHGFVNSGLSGIAERGGTGGIVAAAFMLIFNLFVATIALPVFTVWNFVKFHTGENNSGELNSLAKSAQAVFAGAATSATNVPNNVSPTTNEAPSEPASQSPREPSRESEGSSADTASTAGGSRVGTTPVATTIPVPVTIPAVNATVGSTATASAATVSPMVASMFDFSSAHVQRNGLIVLVGLLFLAGGAYWFSHRASDTSVIPASVTSPTTNPAPAPGASQVYVTRASVVRNAPTTRGSMQMGRLARGDAIQGAWVTGSDGVHQWFKIASGPYTGGYVSTINLATNQPPELVRSFDQDMTVQQQMPLLPSPSTSDTPVDTLNPGTIVHVAGEIAGGWMEVQQKFGGVGYIQSQAFEAPTPAPSVPAQTETAPNPASQPPTSNSQSAPTSSPPTSRVIDDAHILSPQTQEQLATELTKEEKDTGNEIIVATETSVQGRAIDQYAYQLGNAWGAGQNAKNKVGVLLLVVNGHHGWIGVVGPGLQRKLTDPRSLTIIDNELVPAFRRNDYDTAALAGAQAIIKELNGPAQTPGETAPNGTTASLTASTAPSFDCSRVQRWAEIQVCKAPDLATRDRDMAALYRKLFVQSSGADRLNLRESQREWIKSRAACEFNGGLQCLYAVYAERISTLTEKLNGRASQAAPVQASPATQRSFARFDCVGANNQNLHATFIVDYRNRTVRSPDMGASWIGGQTLNAEISDSDVRWHAREIRNWGFGRYNEQDMTINRASGQLTDDYGSGVTLFNCQVT